MAINITPETRVAEIAARNPATIRVFQRFSIDFCRGGKRPLSEVCAENFIVNKYHADLRTELPRLHQMAVKVLNAHGEKHPDVFPELLEVFAGLRQELDSHMMKEERVLFPYAARLEKLAAKGEGLPASHTGSIQAPIGMMEHEHEIAAQALARLRELTKGYAPPSGACNTFRGLYHGLAELERDLHRHIHLENNVLFPRAARLEEELASCAVV